MSRWEFMRRLEELLSDISPSEREEALQYYNDYFNDAGKENEQAVMEALGTPEQVAGIVREGLGDGAGHGEFTEHGFTNTAAENDKNEIVKRNTDSRAGQSESENVPQEEKAKKNDLPAWAIVLIVIACIFLSPAILGLAVSLFGVLAGIVCVILGIVLSLGAVTIILYVVAVALVIGGFGCIIAAPLEGIGLIGGGCICAAIGILFMLLTVFIVGKGIPGICQGISYIWKSIFGKKKGAEV